MKSNGKYLLAVVFSMALLAAATVRTVADDERIVTGDTAMKACLFRLAVTDYEQALKMDPNNGALMVKLAEAYEGSRWYGQSVQLWERYLSRFPEGSEAATAKQHAALNHRWLGSEMYLIGDPTEVASYHLRRAIELDPTQVDAYIWLARVDNSEARYSSALGLLKRASALGSLDVSIDTLRHEAITGNRQLGRARASIERGIQQFDNMQTASALNSFQKAAALNPKATVVHYWIGRSYMAMGQYADASTEFETFVHAKPVNYRTAMLLEQAQQKAGTPLYQLAYFRDLPLILLANSQVASAAESTPIGAPGGMMMCHPER
jgi:Tfp pilus assembly protein PilF